MTQAALADGLGVKASHISLIESDRRKPSLNLVARLADGTERRQCIPAVRAEIVARRIIGPAF